MGQPWPWSAANRTPSAQVPKALNLSNEIWATIEKNITKLIKADAFLKTDGKLAIQFMSAMRKKYLDGDTTADDKPTDGEPSDGDPTSVALETARQLKCESRARASASRAIERHRARSQRARRG